MKKSVTTFVLAGLSIIALQVGCDELKDALDQSFDTGYNEVPFTVDPTAAGNYSTSGIVVVSDLEQEISDNGGDIDNLKGVVVKECIINVVSPDRNLDAFDSFEIFIQAPGKDEVKIAWVENIPAGLTTVSLSFDNTPLKDFLSEDQYTITVKGILDEALEPSIDLIAKIKYAVTVGV